MQVEIAVRLLGEGESFRSIARKIGLSLATVQLCHVVHDEILLEAPEALVQAAAHLLLEVMQDTGLQTRYLRDALPLVAEVKVVYTWADTHKACEPTQWHYFLS